MVSIIFLHLTCNGKKKKVYNPVHRGKELYNNNFPWAFKYWVRKTPLLLHLKMLLNPTFCHDYRDYLDIMAGVSKNFFSANLKILNTSYFFLYCCCIFKCSFDWSLPFVDLININI